jgi:hypothetical protein
MLMELLHQRPNPKELALVYNFTAAMRGLAAEVFNMIQPACGIHDEAWSTLLSASLASDINNAL